MADGQMAGKALQYLGVKDLRHQSQTSVGPHPAAIGGDNPAGLLAPVLKGVKAEIGESGGIGVAVDPEYAALFLETGSLPRPGNFRFWICNGTHRRNERTLFSNIIPIKNKLFLVKSRTLIGFLRVICTSEKSWLTAPFQGETRSSKFSQLPMADWPKCWWW